MFWNNTRNQLGNLQFISNNGAGYSQRVWRGSRRNVVGDELEAPSIRAKDSIGACVWDIGPPLAIGNCDIRNLEGVVREELYRLYHLNLVRVAGSAPMIRFGLPETKETLRLTAISQDGRDCEPDEQQVVGWAHHAHDDSSNAPVIRWMVSLHLSQKRRRVARGQHQSDEPQRRESRTASSRYARLTNLLSGAKLDQEGFPPP